VSGTETKPVSIATPLAMYDVEAVTPARRYRSRPRSALEWVISLLRPSRLKDVLRMKASCRGRPVVGNQNGAIMSGFLDELRNGKGIGAARARRSCANTPCIAPIKTASSAPIFSLPEIEIRPFCDSSRTIFISEMTERNRALVGLQSHFDERGHGTEVGSDATNRTYRADAFAERTSLIRVKMRRGVCSFNFSRRPASGGGSDPPGRPSP
jgi:hypothetical protein